MLIIIPTQEANRLFIVEQLGRCEWPQTEQSFHHHLLIPNEVNAFL